ncbi:hypothetical protein LPJGGPFB_06568 [Ensifer adhaerens]|uniref:ribbon-helix-helix domain-containing protein n=1 Tax=Ensifer adhaerens TaxID=106592 RepID=UPI0015683C7E|nr:ribbon-helix-helix domain-containing protein [Ensifer adhaerens]NRP23298.1 hypothetical protein [Ensifer adhaerens]
MAKKKISMAAAAGAADTFVSGAPDMTAGKPGRPRKPEGDYVRLNVELEADTMAAFKILAIKRGKTIKELVSDMIEREIAKDA